MGTVSKNTTTKTTGLQVSLVPDDTKKRNTGRCWEARIHNGQGGRLVRFDTPLDADPRDTLNRALDGMGLTVPTWTHYEKTGAYAGTAVVR